MNYLITSLYIQYIQSVPFNPIDYHITDIKKVLNQDESCNNQNIHVSYYFYVCHDTKKTQNLDITFYKTQNIEETVKKDCDECFQIVDVRTSIQENTTTTCTNFLEIILPEKVCEQTKKVDLLGKRYFRMSNLTNLLRNDDNFSKIMYLVTLAIECLLEYFGTKIFDYEWSTNPNISDCIILRQKLRKDFIIRYQTLEGDFMKMITAQINEYINIKNTSSDAGKIDDEKKKLYTLLVHFLVECFKLNDEITNTTHSRLLGNNIQDYVKHGDIKKELVTDDILDKYLPAQTNDTNNSNSRNKLLFYGGVFFGILLLIILIIYFYNYFKNK